jgi:hypothetical protein
MMEAVDSSEILVTIYEMTSCYGPVMENNIWRIRYNEEINALLKEKM